MNKVNPADGDANSKCDICQLKCCCCCCCYITSLLLLHHYFAFQNKL